MDRNAGGTWLEGEPVPSLWKTMGWIAALACLSTTPGAAQLRDDLWMTNYAGNVLTSAVQDGILYLGGDFREIVPYTGSAAPLDPVTGLVEGAPPAVRSVTTNNDDVIDIIPDGEGGWFLAGYFEIVGDLPRTCLARIAPDGSLSSWTPGEIFDRIGGAREPGAINALRRVGDTLYIGGNFESVGGADRANLAAIDIPTATVLAWDPGTNGQVTALSSI